MQKSWINIIYNIKKTAFTSPETSYEEIHKKKPQVNHSKIMRIDDLNQR